MSGKASRGSARRQGQVAAMMAALLLGTAGTAAGAGKGVGDLGKPRKNPKREWTVLAYVDADNDLERHLLDDVNEMEDGLHDLKKASGDSALQRVEVIALVDRAKGYVASDGDWHGTRVYRIRPDDTPSKLRSELLADCGELAMSDGRTLEEFVASAMKAFPAKRYALVLSNHGAGWMGLCWDDDQPGVDKDKECMDVREARQALQSALREAGVKKLDLVIHDLCLMGQLEVARELRDITKHVVTSAAPFPSIGHPYELLIPLFGDPSKSTRDVCEQSVRYVLSHLQVMDRHLGRRAGYVPWVPRLTCAALDTAKIDAVSAAFDAVLAKLTPRLEEDWPGLSRSMFFALTYVDRTDYRKGKDAFVTFDMIDMLNRMRANMKDFPAERELQQLHRAIKACQYKSYRGTKYAAGLGMAVYAPPRARCVRKGYDRLLFAESSRWPAFLEKLHGILQRKSLKPKIVDMQVLGPNGKPTKIITPLGGAICTFTVEGHNLLWINVQMGEVRDDAFVVWYKTFHVVPGAARRAGKDAASLLAPTYAEGRNELGQELGGVMFQVVCGDKIVPATVSQTDPGDLEHVEVQATYTHPEYKDLKEIRLRIKYDTTWWKISEVTARVKTASGRYVPRDIVPKPDGKIHLWRFHRDKDNKETFVKSDPVPWGPKGPELIMTAAPGGAAGILLDVETIGGPSANKLALFHVHPNERLQRYFRGKAKLTDALLTKQKWNVQELGQNRQTKKPEYQPADMTVVFQKHPTIAGRLTFLLTEEDGPTSGEAILEPRGLPTLSLYVQGRRQYFFVALLDERKDETGVILRSLNEPGVYRLTTKDGTTPLDDGPPSRIPAALIGTWRAPDGITIQFEATGGFHTSLGQHTLDAGSFTVRGNTITTVSVKGTTQTVTWLLRGNILRITWPDGKTAVLGKIK